MPICVAHAQLIRIEATLGGCVPVGGMYAPAGGMDSKAEAHRWEFYTRALELLSARCAAVGGASVGQTVSACA